LEGFAHLIGDFINAIDPRRTSSDAPSFASVNTKLLPDFERGALFAHRRKRTREDNVRAAKCS
jgi:hypothetical protein